jgi:glycosyltransferase involved in cell wall biosynthesis
MIMRFALVFVLFIELIAQAYIYAINTPYIEHACYDDLCKYVTSYYDTINNSSLIYLPSSVLTKFNFTRDIICIDILESPGELCGQDSLYGFRKPMEYMRLVTVQIYLQSDPSLIFETQNYLKNVSYSLVDVDRYIDHVFPFYGSIIYGKLLVEYFPRSNDNSQRDCEHEFDALGLMKVKFQSNSHHIKSSDEPIEPGSWFMSYSPCEKVAVKSASKAIIAHNPTPPLKSYSYIEFIFTKTEISKERLIRNHQHSSLASPTSSEVCVDGDSCHQSGTVIVSNAKSARRIHVCFWGATNADGQRRIWLDLIKHINPKTFRFSYILSRTGKKKGKDLEDILLSYKNVDVYPSPFNLGFTVPKEVLAAEGLSSNLGNDFYEFITKKLQEAHYNVKKIQSEWVREIYMVMIDAIEPLVCDVLVFGNERGAANDVLITDVARILGYPSVSELMNLFPSSVPQPSVMIGPSLYALQHQSITSTVASIKNESHRPELIVLSPAVDTAKFNNSRADLTPIRNSKCSDDSCLVVGFIGRLAPEKSIGLFIMAAHAISKANQNVRFTVIGDGILKESLLDLTCRLQIEHLFDFIGWVDHEALPSYLLGIDLVINPSLRAWSETFCISNIEVMSMGIPLITFGVGGVGEYLEADEVNMDDDVVIAKNAILLNKASPEVIAGAIIYLLSNPILRHEIGMKGRETVMSRFYLQRQVDEYEKLYQRLGRNKVHTYKEQNKDFFQRSKSKK